MSIGLLDNKDLIYEYFGDTNIGIFTPIQTGKTKLSIFFLNQYLINNDNKNGIILSYSINHKEKILGTLHQYNGIKHNVDNMYSNNSNIKIISSHKVLIDNLINNDIDIVLIDEIQYYKMCFTDLKLLCGIIRDKNIKIIINGLLIEDINDVSYICRELDIKIISSEFMDNIKNVDRYLKIKRLIK